MKRKEEPFRYLVIQEGGSSTERYPALFERASDAEAHRVDCQRSGSYRTSPVIEIPKKVAARVLGTDDQVAAVLCILEQALDGAAAYAYPD